ncbi:uncharacterized protein TNCV_2490191 [Trichonephila clavipes]|nr:uncharacterized protein TNCV_2490191 [Trichonephila clavipes]
MLTWGVSAKRKRQFLGNGSTIKHSKNSSATSTHASSSKIKIPVAFDEEIAEYQRKPLTGNRIIDMEVLLNLFYNFAAQDVSKKVSCFLRIPHMVYGYLKDKILQYFSQSDASRLNLLLHDLQLGDKRPSHLLSEMRNLAPSKLEDDLLQTLWLQRLPANLQQIISVFKAPLDELTQIADKVHEVSGNDLTVARIETKSNQIELDVIKGEIADLTNMF